MAVRNGWQGRRSIRWFGGLLQMAAEESTRERLKTRGTLTRAVHLPCEVVKT
uniref:Uncharacterized protein n=1 Tax=Cucumis melo TaxID=3656 RepID=A0A9I9CTW2_CUCME